MITNQVLKIVSEKRHQMVIFDVDGTLVERDTAVPLTNTQKTIDYLHGSGLKMGLATNQGGPACRDAGWGDKYPTFNQVNERIGAVESLFKIHCSRIAWAYEKRDGGYILPNAPHLRLDEEIMRRKPNPGLLRELASVAKVMPQFILMVGDGEADKMAASNFGCEFMWAQDFFGW